METTEKRTKPSKDQEETRVIQLGPTPSTPIASSGDGGEYVKSIQTERERRRRKQSVIVERDDDDEYR